MASKQHYVKYLTQDEVFLAIKEWKTGRKEDLKLSIRALKGVSVARSRKLSMVIISDNEEYCPHCRSALRFYDVVNRSPKYCYCMWCGGAIERPKGNKNGHFNYNLIKDKPDFENEYPNRPSMGQIKFARAISSLLGIPLPENTATNYWSFINTHQGEYYRALNNKRSSKDGKQLSDVRQQEWRSSSVGDFRQGQAPPGEQ